MAYHKPIAATFKTSVSWLASFVLPTVLLILAFFYSHSHHLPDYLLTIDTVEQLAYSGSNPPAEFNDGTAQTLPHDWAQNPPLQDHLWYRTILDLNVPPNRLWGVYLPTVNMNAAVYLNGELLGDGGDFADPVARNWNRPLYFSIPNGLLLPGENEIHVRIKADPRQDGLLEQLYLGPDHELRPYFKARYFGR
ncbi:MAG: hypothetical protein HC808_08720 [Candidatus Competibacteraceae bacterium]|nr:hypothetical protein [Candidatus Competibacteraceae bacterium]